MQTRTNNINLILKQMASIQTTKMSNFRWVICALLFLATTVNYMDRQVLSLTWKDFIAPGKHGTIEAEKLVNKMKSNVKRKRR